MKNIKSPVLISSLLLVSTLCFADGSELSIEGEEVVARQLSENRLNKIDPISGLLRRHLHDTGTARSSSRLSENNWIAVNIAFAGSASIVAEELRSVGMDSLTVSDSLISGRVRASELAQLRTVSGIIDVRESIVYTKNTTDKTQGDLAMETDLVRQSTGLTGMGVRVGVMSDSFSCLDDGNGMMKDIEMGELPSQTFVVKEAESCEGRLDEGRALAQVIHDIAPGAEIYFHTAAGIATGGLADAIKLLVERYAVDVIVDDFATIDMPFFQDNIVSQTIDAVTEGGVAFVTAAGNAGSNSYTSRFRNVFHPGLESNLHDFDPTENVNVFQPFTLPEGDGILLIMQWDDPYRTIGGSQGAKSDLDIHVLNEDKSEILQSSSVGNIGTDPYEVIKFYNPEESGETAFNFMISLEGGPAPNLVKYLLPLKFDGSMSFQHDSEFNNGATILGHSNAAGAISVGATAYRETPRFGLSKPTVEEFSSRGGTPILFNTRGERYVDGAVFRTKPDITAPNSVNTSFFKGDDIEGDGKPNFRGTSASAPHVAGLIALMLERDPSLPPWKIARILHLSATDIVHGDSGEHDLGFDLSSGFGFVNAVKALELVDTQAELLAPEVKLPAGDGYQFSDTDEESVVTNPSVSGALSEPGLLVLFLSSLVYIRYRALLQCR